ncbi:myosin heavy chain, skeletal muscle, adult-like isoform X2 [Athalia rosae]|uniref:myosin heavy chain, skeletal muscle, adult-like isoform X2 n=1 Tax=Athalia rosae TaxID=37344 RepID=UPI0020334AC3|nr:myosin heavy chain, skeletal muscle, adult-like isoform X2 [Athalia rosae]
MKKFDAERSARREEELRAEIQKLKGALEAKIAEGAAQKSENLQLKGALQTKIAEGAAQKAEIQKLKGALQTKIAEGAAQKSENVELEDALQTKIAEGAAQKAEIQKLKGALQTKIAEGAAQKSENVELEDALQTKIAEGAAQKAEIQKLKGALQTKIAEGAAQKSENVELEDALQTKIAEGAAQKAEIQKLKGALEAKKETEGQAQAPVPEKTEVIAASTPALIAQPRMHARSRSRSPRPFTLAEDLQILRYLTEGAEGRLARFRGMTVWQELAATELLPGRSAHTLSGRFRKVILNRIEDYSDLPERVRSAVIAERDGPGIEWL